MSETRLQMDPGEIAREWRSAKNPRDQIGILAAVNATTPARIEAILREQGCDPDRLPGPAPQDEADILAAYRSSSSKNGAITALATTYHLKEKAVARFLRDKGETIPKPWYRLIDTPDRGSPEDLRRIAERTKKAQATRAAKKAAPATAPAPAPAESPSPAPLTAHVTVGNLLELLTGLPADCPVLLNGEADIRSVTFVREYNASTGQTDTSVRLD